ncbi:hypothetical protein KIN20_003549 [Parelaphostrongylus tenuis]|uniref:Uncharacterized protein n=1 Tax=Parelaphostrongylus tenuis TaxID=148309 RepID=A0AAD5MQ26_PARTN|nr:hypothetical protein KIN20_003549 [Parelaphostrongylus tenuis]
MNRKEECLAITRDMMNMPECHLQEITDSHRATRVEVFPYVYMRRTARTLLSKTTSNDEKD